MMLLVAPCVFDLQSFLGNDAKMKYNIKCVTFFVLDKKSLIRTRQENKYLYRY